MSEHGIGSHPNGDHTLVKITGMARVSSHMVDTDTVELLLGLRQEQEEKNQIQQTGDKVRH
jgi:hypothetical protein